VKPLDFGIARTLDRERSSGDTTLTGHAHPMTLAYASPEQVRREPITTASAGAGRRRNLSPSAHRIRLTRSSRRARAEHRPWAPVAAHA
jgi:hypothetical protein